jgi:NAD-dependent SIR2 family protein deacetylase
VIGESDIDFTICIGTELKVAKFEEYYKTIGEHFLEPLGFTYTKLYNSTKEEEKYQVFTKEIDGIEIEAKIRNLGAFGSLLKYHNYMNDK